MQSADITLFWIGFWIYLASFMLFSVFAASKRRMTGIAAMSLFSAALVLHTAGLIARWSISSHIPMATMYEYSLTMSWVIGVFFIFLVARFRKMGIGIVVSPVMIIVLVIASMLPKNASALMPALQSYWFYIHVSLAAVSEGAFIFASGAGALYLLGGRKGRAGSILPSRELLEEMISRSIRLGYPLFTIGALFAGAIWAQYAWGRFWSWDPKETGALVIWLFYTLVLHQDVRGNWRGSRLAVVSLVGLGIILLSFLGNLFLGGLHSYI
ncbi:MAG TPA: c-type cytochrome biogenesis protein CcsB [Candidatus Krumholzibacterium sp.]|nr:c-type cytochrome biogenesis protein CcsB [Candidatus Krumholzibacterium sp.]